MPSRNRPRRKTNDLYPQRSRSHVLEALSERYLRAVLPTEWIVRPIEGGDYGLDQQVEIVIDERVTGATCTIQLKATDNITISKGRFVSHSCKTTTLQYFLDRPEPVIYIVYDATHNIAYWIWIQDYIRQHLKTSWRQQQKNTISIPLDQRLDGEAVAAIQRRVLEQHHVATMLSTTETLNRDDPYFYYRFARTPTGAEIAVQAKQVGIPEEELMLNATLTLDNTPEAQEALNAWQTMIETGAPVTIPGRFVRDLQLPRAITQFDSPSTSYHLHELEITPLPSNDSRQIQVRLLDQAMVVLANGPQIEMRIIQEGTAETTFGNLDGQTWLTIRLRERQTGQVDISLQIDISEQNVVQAQRALHFQHALSTAAWLELLEVETDMPQRLPMQNVVVDEPVPELEEVIDALVLIQKQTNTRLIWPGCATIDEAHRIRALETILTCGHIQVLASEATFGLPLSGAQRFAAEHKGDRPFMMALEHDEYAVELFGVLIHLGPLRMIFPHVTLTPPARRRLGQLGKRRDTASVEIGVTVHQPVLYVFPNWYVAEQPAPESVDPEEASKP